MELIRIHRVTVVESHGLVNDWKTFVKNCPALVGNLEGRGEMRSHTGVQGGDMGTKQQKVVAVASCFA